MVFVLRIYTGAISSVAFFFELYCVETHASFIAFLAASCQSRQNFLDYWSPTPLIYKLST